MILVAVGPLREIWISAASSSICTGRNTCAVTARGLLGSTVAYELALLEFRVTAQNYRKVEGAAWLFDPLVRAWTPCHRQTEPQWHERVSLKHISFVLPMLDRVSTPRRRYKSEHFLRQAEQIGTQRLQRMISNSRRH
jgi:hypothetical protein